MLLFLYRQANLDLALLLAKDGYAMPTKSFWHFDNSGENKNKEMFLYAALLNQKNCFEDIYINFLIVGHTHSSIDQYFGVLSKLVKKSRFVASPIALRYMFEHHPAKDHHKAVVQREISFVYDYVAAMAPYLNTKIKYYGAPHVFRFKRILGVSICQYKMFSAHNQWLPLTPDQPAVNREILYAKHSSDVQLRSSLQFIAHSNKFEVDNGVVEKSITKVSAEELRKAQDYSEALPFLHGLEVDAFAQNAKRHEIGEF